MKENKGKEVVDEPHPSIGDKRKTLPKTLDLGNLPNRRGKKAKHGSSRPGVVKPSLPTSLPSVQIFYVDSSIPIEVTPAKCSHLVSAFPEDSYEPSRK